MNSQPNTSLVPAKTGGSRSEKTEILATFRLGEAWYGLDAMRIQEIILRVDCTPIHSAPPYVLGIINLRGKIVTVFDLARRIGLGSVNRATSNRILVVPWEEESIGLLVEAVGDVVYPQAESIQPPPANVSAERARYYAGVYRSGGHLYTILRTLTLLEVSE